LFDLVIGGSHSGVRDSLFLLLTISDTKSLFQNLVSVTSE